MLKELIPIPEPIQEPIPESIQDPIPEPIQEPIPESIPEPISKPIPIPEPILEPILGPIPEPIPILESIPETDSGSTIRNRLKKTSKLAGIDSEKKKNIFPALNWILSCFFLITSYNNYMVFLKWINFEPWNLSLL